jgi:nicotinate phosphoribosyltransferase
MPADHPLYRPSLGLLTDFYELTMGYSYWKSGRAEDEAVFDFSFREAPFGGGYAIACGLESVLDFIRSFSISREDTAYLGTLKGNDGKPIFSEWFLDYLLKMKLRVTVHAAQEGAVVFAGEPLLRIRGPLVQCQILETPILNAINFQTLIATKASRICQASRGEPVLEFGLRRAQGFDGGLSASRASFVGGCAATSNVLAGRLYGIPVRGTHAHSWVMAFDIEEEAFDTFANAMPNNAVLLVDTYDTLEGVRKAARVGQRLRKRGYKLIGIRLDSGDLAELSIQARMILDEAGLQDTRIYGSNDLDEEAIEDLKRKGARINVWGVGTRLVTGWSQSALGGICKLTALRRTGEAEWRYPMKLSEDEAKVSTPGIHQIRRFFSGGKACGDMVFHEDDSAVEPRRMIVPRARGMAIKFSAELPWEDLLVEVVREGTVIAERRTTDQIRTYSLKQLERFDEVYRRLRLPEPYPVGLEENLERLKRQMHREAKNQPKAGAFSGNDFISPSADEPGVLSPEDALFSTGDTVHIGPLREKLRLEAERREKERAAAKAKLSAEPEPPVQEVEIEPDILEDSDPGTTAKW